MQLRLGSRATLAGIGVIGGLAIAGMAGSIAGAASSAASAAATVAAPASAAPAVAGSGGASAHQGMLTQYCSTCHNDRLKTANFSTQQLDANNVAGNVELWEKVLRRVSLGEMPPKGMRRPDAAQLTEFNGWLETSLDDLSAKNPDPGRATLRRLNRVEYNAAVQDLLDINVDVSKQLPADDSGYGFDNIADVLTVSPALIDRYLAVASQISTLAVGVRSRQPGTAEFKPAKDNSINFSGVAAFNELASTDLPIDSRGGGSFDFYAPYDGEYVVRMVLNTNQFNEPDPVPEAYHEFRTTLKAGPRKVGIAFQKFLDLDEEVVAVDRPPSQIIAPQQPARPTRMELRVDGVKVAEKNVESYMKTQIFYQASFPRDIYRVWIVGPFEAGSAGDTPSQKKIFSCRPSASPASETACAKKIFTRLATQAYRRPATPSEVDTLMGVYERGRKGKTFEQGVASGLSAILVSPKFLFVEEAAPKGLKAGSVYRISDRELATRLSLFLWSGPPDVELRNLAEKKQLRRPAVLRAQVKRMLADPRADALTKNFAGQWLYLRNIDQARPDYTNYPNFDQRLRFAMRTESEMFFDAIVREDRPVLDFIKADYTFLNERLAKHYGISGVSGPAFRKVKLTPESHRGGLLGQASILTVTSYDNRTSVVKRGVWILDNLLAAPPPPPPPDVPALNEKAASGKVLSSRDQIALHRANPVCAACHNKMDPLGLALENYDAVGAWRDKDAGDPVDASAVLPDGTQFVGSTGLQNVLLSRKDQFVEAFIDRLLTYALGRGLRATDMPAVRKIRDQAIDNDYRMQTIITGIVESLPFQNRRVPEA
jgi:mono/diheme cytochrome c family protein